jgi:hypothetical protein
MPSALRTMGHAANDNRHGLVARAMATTAADAERDAATVMIPDADQGQDNPENSPTRRATTLHTKKAQMHQGRLWVVQSCRQNASGDGSWTGESRPDVCAHGGRLGPHAHAHPGKPPNTLNQIETPLLIPESLHLR